MVVFFIDLPSPNLSWTWNKDDPLWIAGPVVDAIASLPLMDDFRLEINNVDAAISFKLDRLSGLQKFVVRGWLAPSVLGSLAEVIGNSPNLSHLVISVPNSSTPCMPFSKTPSTTSLPLRYLAVKASKLDLNPICHIIGLHSFNLEHTGLDTSVYLDLAQAHLFCSRLIVHHVNSALLNYLSQYSGTLQELSLLLGKDSNALAGQFWATVLPEHAATLQVLNVCSRVGGGWCYSDQAIHAIMQCSQLRSLTLTVDPHSTGQVRLFTNDSFEHDCDQSAFDKIVSFKLLFVERIISKQMDSGFFHYGLVIWLAQSYPYSHTYCPVKFLAPLLLP